VKHSHNKACIEDGSQCQQATSVASAA